MMTEPGTGVAVDADAHAFQGYLDLNNLAWLRPL